MFIFKNKKKVSIKKFKNIRFLKSNLIGEIEAPADKSISQRALLIALICGGTSKISNILDSEDVYYTLQAIKALGAKITIKGKEIFINGVGVGNFISPEKPIYMGNSGTGTRLLMGLLAGSNATATLYGDKSLTSRPMERITIPLTKMGACFFSRDGKRLPMTVIGARKKGFVFPITYNLPVASAQVKSSILFASLSARGETVIKEKTETRNNTELMLSDCGVDIKTKKTSTNGNLIKIKNNKNYLDAQDFSIPGDPSSAAFIIVAALITEKSNVLVRNVYYDKFRLKIFDILIKMGGKIKISKISEGKKCEIRAKSSKLSNISIGKKYAAALIDEYPILSVAAAFGKGKMIFAGLTELKYKESNRYKAIHDGLRECGVKVTYLSNGLKIEGAKKIQGGCLINANNDHRIAMAFNVLSLISEKPIKVIGNKAITSSFPSFFNTFESLGALKASYD